MTDAGKRLLDYSRTKHPTQTGYEAMVAAIEAGAVAPYQSALQQGYDLIMLLAFAKPEAEVGVPQTFKVLDVIRPLLFDRYLTPEPER